MQKKKRGSQKYKGDHSKKDKEEHSQGKIGDKITRTRRISGDQDQEDTVKEGKEVRAKFSARGKEKAPGSDGGRGRGNPPPTPASHVVGMAMEENNKALGGTLHFERERKT